MSINLTLLLAAIATIETGSQPHPDAAVGAAGERSCYQMSAAVWKSHSHSDFTVDSANHELAYTVAEAHIISIFKNLEAHHIPVTIENLAGSWKSPQRVLTAHWTASTRDYAQRVENIYNSLLAEKTNSDALDPEKLRFTLSK